MKKLAVLAVGLASALVLAMTVGAKGPPLQATGGAWSVVPGVWATHVVFQAHDGAKGSVEIWEYNLVTDTLFQHFTGDVDCYYQPAGNSAYFSGDVTRTDPASVPTQQLPNKPYFRVAVQDNGEGAKAAPDKMEFNRPSSIDANCGQFTPRLDVTEGNVQVHAQY